MRQRQEGKRREEKRQVSQDPNTEPAQPCKTEQRVKAKKKKKRRNTRTLQ